MSCAVLSVYLKQLFSQITNLNQTNPVRVARNEELLTVVGVKLGVKACGFYSIFISNQFFEFF